MRPDRPDETDRTPDDAELLRRARDVRSRAYAPYSHFTVGAVVVTATGQVFEGVNIENASYRVTTCAEQSAVAAMVSSGSRGPITAVAIVGDGEAPCTPCGACRQTLFEFGPDATVIASGTGGRPLLTSVRDLLPHAFGPRHLVDGAG